MLLHDLEEDEDKWIPGHLYGVEGINAEIRKLRGHKMRTLEGLMNEFGAALQFFDGFGENGPALLECLCYMDEWLPAEAYVLVISGCTDLLRDDREDLDWFIELMNEVGEWWSRPISDGDRFDRPAIPFHVVMQCGVNEVDDVKRHIGDVPLLRGLG